MFVDAFNVLSVNALKCLIQLTFLIVYALINLIPFILCHPLQFLTPPFQFQPFQETSPPPSAPPALLFLN